MKFTSACLGPSLIFSRPARNPRITSACLRISIYTSPNAKFTSFPLRLGLPAAASMPELLVLVSKIRKSGWPKIRVIFQNENTKGNTKKCSAAAIHFPPIHFSPGEKGIRIYACIYIGVGGAGKPAHGTRISRVEAEPASAFCPPCVCQQRNPAFRGKSRIFRSADDLVSADRTAVRGLFRQRKRG